MFNADLSPRGDYLAVAHTGGKVALIDLKQGKCVASVKETPVIMGFSPDASKLLLITRNDTSLVNTSSGLISRVRNGNAPAVPPAAGDRLVIGATTPNAGNPLITFWDTSTGNIAAKLDTFNVKQAGVKAVSRDGRWFATLGQRKTADARGIEVFDLKQTDQPVASMTADMREYSDLAFTTDGQRLLIAAWHSIHVFDYRKGRVDFVIAPPAPGKPAKDERDASSPEASVLRATREQLGFSSTPNRERFAMRIKPIDGNRVYTMSDDGDVQLWDIAAGRRLVTFSSIRWPGERLSYTGQSPLSTVLTSHDGRRLVIVSQEEVHVFDMSRYASRDAAVASSP